MSVKLFSQDNLSFFYTLLHSFHIYIFLAGCDHTRQYLIYLALFLIWSSHICFCFKEPKFIQFFQKKTDQKTNNKKQTKKTKNKIIIKKNKTKTQPKQRRILLQINLFLKFYTCRSTNLLHGQFNSVKATISF